MLKEVRIQNYKSIQKLKLELGRVTVLIGENGCGKSNILEAIALASAAADDKLDNEFLASRGIRVTEPQLMRSAFEKKNLDKDIKIDIKGNKQDDLSFILHNDNNSSYPLWIDRNSVNNLIATLENYPPKSKEIQFQSFLPLTPALKELNEVIELKKQEILKLLKNTKKIVNPRFSLLRFIIYSPENQALRTFEKEGQIQPLGINGEGLFKLIKVLNSDENQGPINQIKAKLRLIDWFKDFELPQNLSLMQSSLQIKDRYLDTISLSK